MDEELAPRPGTQTAKHRASGDPQHLKNDAQGRTVERIFFPGYMRESRERKLADGPSSVKVVNSHWQRCGWGSRPFQLFWEDGKTPWGKLRAPWDIPKGDLCLPVVWSAQSLREIWFKAYLAAVIHSSLMGRHESSSGFFTQRAMQYLNICHWWMCKFPCCHHHIQHGAFCSSSQKNHLGPFCSRAAAKKRSLVQS